MTGMYLQPNEVIGSIGSGTCEIPLKKNETLSL